MTDPNDCEFEGHEFATTLDEWEEGLPPVCIHCGIEFDFERDGKQTIPLPGETTRCGIDARTEKWAAADIERMQQVLKTISNLPGARKYLGTILHDAAIDLAGKR